MTATYLTHPQLDIGLKPMRGHLFVKLDDAKPPTGLGAKAYFDELWKRLILVRYFDRPRVKDRVRISIGNDAEMDKLLAATREILS